MSMFISSIAKQVDIYSYSVIVTVTAGEINYAFEEMPLRNGETIIIIIFISSCYQVVVCYLSMTTKSFLPMFAAPWSVYYYSN